MWSRTVSLAVATFILAAACGTGEVSPTFGPNTPTDLRALTSETLARVADAVPARAECLDGLVVSGAWELDDRARYDPASREMTVRIPATAAQLETSIVHETAHHMEFTCPQTEEVRGEFIAAQGLPANTTWFDGSSWETTPSEQWATAMVLYVLGEPDERARISVSADAMEIVRAWAGGP